MNPFDKMIDVMKPAWMKHPTWRWADSLQYGVAEDHHLLADPFVGQMGMMYKMLKDPARHMRMMIRTFPEAYGAWMIASRNTRLGAKWNVEAMIMAGADDDYINKQLPMDECGGKDVYRMYRGIYFDVDDYLDKRNAVMNNIFATSLGKADPLSDCDVLWKMLAYELGLEDFERFQAHMSGSTLPDEIQQYMFQFQQGRAIYYSMHQISDLRLMYNDALRELLSMARSHFKYDDEMARDQEEKRISGCVKQLLGSVEYALLEPSRKMPPIDVVNNFSCTLVEKIAN